jgi:hypothetical protein
MTEGRLMSILSDITSVIGLVQKAKQLADQLRSLELKEVIVDLQSKMLDLKQEVNSLREENEELKKKIKDAPMAAAHPKETPEVMYGCYYFGGDSSKLYCPRCYETQGKKHIMASHHHMGFKCTVCSNFIPR